MTKVDSNLKLGDVVPIEYFHISKVNVRYEETFGESDNDKNIISNIKSGGIVQPFKVRPEKKSFGVVIGRRRFLAKKDAGIKKLVYGLDFVLEEMSDEKAQEASLIENLRLFREQMNPLTRAKQLQKLIKNSNKSLRATARRLKIPASTLSDWIKILELSDKIQDVIKKELLLFTEALELSRLKLSKNLQDKLAKTLEKRGYEEFKNEIERYIQKKKKRGIPEGKYIVSRIVWNKSLQEELKNFKILEQLAKGQNMKTEDFAKKVITDYVKQKSQVKI